MPGSRKESRDRERREKGGDGLVSALLWVGGMICAWAAVELALKPLLQAGRAAIRKSLDPDYDVDDELDNSNNNNNESNTGQGAGSPPLHPLPDEEPKTVIPKQSAPPH